MTRKFDFSDKRFVIEALNLELTYENVFHYKTIYQHLHEWFLREGFTDVDGDSDHWETLYWERVNQGGAKEHHIWWRMLRIPRGENPSNPFVIHFVKLNFQALGMKTVEASFKGKRLKTNKGELNLRLKALVVVDPYKKFRNHWLLKHYMKFLLTHVYKDRLFREEATLKKDVEGIINRFKQYMQMITEAMPKPFFPEKGVGTA